MKIKYINYKKTTHAIHCNLRSPDVETAALGCHYETIANAPAYIFSIPQPDP